MAVESCLEAVEEAMARHGKPDIFNTDQGSQFTSAAFTGLLADNGIAISMDGRGAWRDNVFVERQAAVRQRPGGRSSTRRSI
jgi:putative transposase